jgi:hypothetical protein
VEMAVKSKALTFEFFPDFETNFSPLDFDDEEKEYMLARMWAQTHNPKLLTKEKKTSG